MISTPPLAVSLHLRHLLRGVGAAAIAPSIHRLCPQSGVVPYELRAAAPISASPSSDLLRPPSPLVASVHHPCPQIGSVSGGPRAAAPDLPFPRCCGGATAANQLLFSASSHPSRSIDLQTLGVHFSCSRKYRVGCVAGADADPRPPAFSISQQPLPPSPPLRLSPSPSSTASSIPTSISAPLPTACEPFSEALRGGGAASPNALPHRFVPPRRSVVVSPKIFSRDPYI